jgi:hypothetical protein
MTTSFFQQYEQRRKRYKPGAIWVDKGRHIVKKLQIIDRSKLSPEIKVEELYQTGVTISFRVLEARHGDSRLSPGVIGDWSKVYMENNYEVLIDG